jgi:SPP1 family predicted phage head-tail adaptor
MAKMKSGDLRHPVDLLKPVTGTDSRRTTSYVKQATVYAAKSDVSGREFFQAHAVNAEDIVTFTIRWRDDIDTTWRVQHGADVYNVLEVNHLGYMRDYMRLKCRAVTGGGV